MLVSGVMRITDRSVFAGLFIASLAAYANALHAPFLFDDFHTIVHNTGIRNLADLRQVFTSDSAARPLLFLSFALNFAAGGLDPFGYHIANLLLHAGSACLVFLILADLLDRAGAADRVYAAFGAMLFALHPMAVETVTYVSSRSDGMATFFYLLALLLIVRGGLAGRGSLAAIVAAAVAGLLTKETAITLPALATVYVLVFGEREKMKGAAVPLAILWMLVPAYFLFRTFATGYPLEETVGASISPRNYFLTQLTIVPFHYLPRLFLPVHQVFDADLDLVESMADQQMWAGAGVVFSLIAFALARHRQSRIPAFAILWFFGAISVTSSFYPIFDTYAERRVYLPLPAFCLAVSYALYRFASRGEATRKLSMAAMLAVLALFGIFTHQRNHLFAAPVLLLEDNVSKNFTNGRMRLMLYSEYVKRGEMEKAEETLMFAIKAFPAAPEIQLAYCWWLGHKGDFGQMEETLAGVKPVRDGEWAMYYNFKGVLAGQRGDHGGAMRFFRQSLQHLPTYADTHANIIVLLKLTGKTGEAVAYARGLIRKYPYIPDYHFQMGMALMDTDPAGAMAEFRAALNLDPSHHRAREMLENPGGGTGPPAGKRI